LQKYLATKVSITPMPQCCVFFHYTLVEKMIHAMVKKTMDLQMLPNLASTTIVTTSFDL
jgi:hypothetical protein